MNTLFFLFAAEIPDPPGAHYYRLRALLFSVDGHDLYSPFSENSDDFSAFSCFREELCC